MTLMEIRPETRPTTASKSVRLVWFASGDCRTCRNHEAMLNQVEVEAADLTTAKIDVRDDPASIVERDIIVLPTTVIEVDGVEVLRFAGTPSPAKVAQHVERSLAVT